MSAAPDRPRIARVHAEGFRSLYDVDLALGNLTVLVGPNAAGKSNVVDALRFARDVVAIGGKQAIAVRERSGAVIARGADRCRMSVEVESHRDRVRLGVHVRRGGWTTSEAERWDPLAEEWSATTHPGTPPLDALGDAVFYDFEPAGLRQPQRALPASPLQEDGSNFVSVLRAALDGPDGDTVRHVMSSLVEGAGNVTVREVGAHVLAELLYRTPDGVRYPSDVGIEYKSDLGLESDGTVWALALLTALYQSPPPPLIAIEEPERFLHPGALAYLADSIREVSTRTQVLITTHSPDLLRSFDPDDIRIVERVDGATVVGPVDATQREIIRDRLFSPGEIMRVQGLYRALG